MANLITFKRKYYFESHTQPNLWFWDVTGSMLGWDWLPWLWRGGRLWL